MVKNISELYGLDIYSDEGRYVGKVNDVILNVETGRVVRLTTVPLRNISRDEAARVIKDNSVIFDNVRAVGDIIIVNASKR